jgi:hypothetical protein
MLELCNSLNDDQVCSVAFQCVMLILVDTISHIFPHSQFAVFFQTTCFSPMWPSSGSNNMFEVIALG